MSPFQGFFSLQNHRDLLSKLQHDLQRLKDSPMDTYAAFDFFVTAEHMLDWLYPGADNEDQRKNLRNSVTLLQIVSHIANGSKHFKATAPHHKSVKDTHETEGVFDSIAFDPTAFDVGELLIELQGKAANEYGDTISADKLADKVVAFWEKHMAGP